MEEHDDINRLIAELNSGGARGEAETSETEEMAEASDGRLE